MTDDTSALALQSLRAAYDLLLCERDRLRAEVRDLERELRAAHDLFLRERDRLRAEVRDLDRENASLRRRLREGGR